MKLKLITLAVAAAAVSVISLVPLQQRLTIDMK